MKTKWSDEAQQTWDESLEYCVVYYHFFFEKSKEKRTFAKIFTLVSNN
jgi:hypothetical protein